MYRVIVGLLILLVNLIESKPRTTEENEALLRRFANSAFPTPASDEVVVDYPSIYDYMPKDFAYPCKEVPRPKPTAAGKPITPTSPVG